MRMRMHMPRPASWTGECTASDFLPEKYGPCSQSRPCIYPRSQLSRPSFSSRSNNNNHYLFAYTTPGPTSRIKFSLPRCAERRRGSKSGDLRFPELNTLSYRTVCCVAIFENVMMNRNKCRYFFLDNCNWKIRCNLCSF